MVELLKHREVKHSRQSHDCMASMWLRDSLGCIDFTFAEKRAIVIARSKGWKILQGEPCVYQFGKYEGDTYEFRGIPAIHAMCIKYDLYCD